MFFYQMGNAYLKKNTIQSKSNKGNIIRNLNIFFSQCCAMPLIRGSANSFACRWDCLGWIFYLRKINRSQGPNRHQNLLTLAYKFILMKSAFQRCRTSFWSWKWMNTFTFNKYISYLNDHCYLNVLYKYCLFLLKREIFVTNAHLKSTNEVF